MRNANQRMLLWSVFMMLAATLPGTGTIWAATATPPQIASASQIFTTDPTQLQIQGSGFGSLRPIVVLGGTPLFILSYTDTMVFATVPVAVPEGTYALVLTSADPKIGSSAPFEVAIGAVGSTGATGPAGAQGPAGSMGPAGSAGSPGAAGACRCARSGWAGRPSGVCRSAGRDGTCGCSRSGWADGSDGPGGSRRSARRHGACGPGRGFGNEPPLCRKPSDLLRRLFLLHVIRSGCSRRLLSGPGYCVSFNGHRRRLHLRSS